MNKIVLSFGLLVFFISIVVYSQQGLELIEIFKRSFAVFMVVTVMFTILAILFIKAINQAAAKKAKQLNEKSYGNDRNE